MQNPLLIRPAERTDRRTLGALGALLIRVHHAFDSRRFLAPGTDPATGYGAFLASQVGRPDTIVLVAEAAGAVVGYVYAALEPRDWQALRDEAGVIHDLVVAPAHRGVGVGAALLRDVIAALRSRGATQVVLSTASQNAAAQRLFRRFGFRPTMIEMTLDLDDPRGSAP